MKERCFMVEGKKNVLEAIGAGYNFRHLLCTENFHQSNEHILSNVGPAISIVDENTLTDLGTFQTNHDCMAVLEMPDDLVDNVTFDDHIVVLDGVGDPGNMGTIIRTLDWFGINNLVCSSGCADVYNPKVINATMGSFTRVNVVYTDLKEFIQSSPLKSFGADLEGTEIGKWDTSEPVMLVMGSESHGLSAEVSDCLSGKVTIPKKGGAESLNVAIATGILCQQLRA